MGKLFGNTCRDITTPHETNLPTKKEETSKDTWLPKANEELNWQKRPKTTPSKGPKEAYGV